MPWEITTERAIIEVKMSGRAELWQDIPDYIEWQCRAQLACTDIDVVYIVVLAAMRLLTFPVFRERDKEAELSDAVDWPSGRTTSSPACDPSRRHRPSPPPSASTTSRVNPSRRHRHPVRQL
jgi:hypothetical protein